LSLENYLPDLIIAHPGWGEALFLADLWPAVPQVHYLEFDYGNGSDIGFDPEFAEPATWQSRARQRMKTANNLLNMQAMTWGYTPTRFQWSTLPSAQRQRVSVIHDGIDTHRLRPDPTAIFTLPNGVQFRPGDPLLTFVNRTFEPYRGVHRLLRALPELQRRWPALQVLLIGRDSSSVSYGKSRADGRGWLTALRDELEGQLDWSRIHAPGALPYSQFIRAMQVSAVHVYFSYPFVLSWSLLEAMACGALVVGSATEPVQEVISHGVNGFLVGFHDQDALIERVSTVLANPGAWAAIRHEARRSVQQRYRLKDCIARQLHLIDAVASGCMGTIGGST
jgi:glycosyltransferase involved in cell wall biosynthesis